MATTSTNDTALQLAAADRKFILHPLLGDDVDERVIMTRGEGCQLFDAEGHEYLDATGGLWLAQVGHGRAELAQVAAAQMQKLEYFMSFWEFSNEPAIELATKLVEISPKSVERVFFTSGGSEGDDAAVRMARLYWNRKGQPDRTWIISRKQAYHGVGGAGVSATGVEVYKQGFGPMLPDFKHVTPAWPYRSELFDGQDPTDFLIAELEATIAELGPNRVAAFIGEPIMGVAGMIVPPPDYWPRVQEVCKRHGILLILDEVVTAYGRSGTWFATEHYNLSPDIIVTAKGISSGYVPLGAVLVSDDVASTLASDGGFPNGYTYNGHPVACAVGLANLGIIEREGLIDAARDMGAYLLSRLKELERFEIVGEVRGIGMMLAIELVADRETRKPLPLKAGPLSTLVRREANVIVRDSGHSLVLSPPLVLNREQADQIVDALAYVIERLRPSGEYVSGN